MRGLGRRACYCGVGAAPTVTRHRGACGCWRPRRRRAARSDRACRTRRWSRPCRRRRAPTRGSNVAIPGPRHCSQLTRSDWFIGSSSGCRAGLLMPATRAPRSARGFGLPSSTTDSVSDSGLPTSARLRRRRIDDSRRRVRRLVEIDRRAAAAIGGDRVGVDLPDRPQAAERFQRDAVGLERPHEILILRKRRRHIDLERKLLPPRLEEFRLTHVLAVEAVVGADRGR